MPLPPSLDRLRAQLGDRLPLGLREGRLAVSPAAALAVALVALFAVAGTAVVLWHGRARPVTVGPAAAQSSISPTSPAIAPSAAEPVTQSSPSAVASPTPSGRVVVDVAGQVRHPGVATLPAGARVIDALTWAGGALPGTNTSSIDLARPLTDGEQVYLGPPGGGASAAGPAQAASGAQTSGSSAPAGPIDLNTATAEQLDSLPGVGPVLAGRIVDWRTTHGRFTSVDELQQVSGLGGKKFETIRPLVRV